MDLQRMHFAQVSQQSISFIDSCRFLLMIMM
jgi:hypothetical protein